MPSLEAELARSRDLDVTELADAIESIGFECTRCGACCTADPTDPHTATVFPDEVRHLGDRSEREWRDVARPMPYGLRESTPGDIQDPSEPAAVDESQLSGETLEWALQTDDCGNCTFYAPADDGPGGLCTVHPERPLVCRTYPFSVALAGTTQPLGQAVEQEGPVRAHECEGLGRDIDRDDALELAAVLKTRAVRELEEALALLDGYEPVDLGPEEIVVHDSEGAKRPDGTPIERD